MQDIATLAPPDYSRTAPRQRPLEIAKDTFVIRALTPSVGGTWTNLNAMVIRGAEPVLVDTGMATDRETWFEDVFSLIAPEDVRWIFVTHLDTDHSGNLVEALARCPDAQAVTSRGESFRVTASLGIPDSRLRIVDDAFDVGDRVLRPARPPVYDSPYTRGLFDPATGVFYSSDAFCAPMPEGPVDWVDEIPDALWAQGLARFHHASLCPWVALVDRERYRREVDRLAELDIAVIAGAHTPPLRGASVRRGFEELARLPEFAL